MPVRIPAPLVVESLIAIALIAGTSGTAAQPAGREAEPAPTLSSTLPSDERPPETAPASLERTTTVEPSEREAMSDVKVTPLGYVEAYYAYNANRPSNGITHFRGFDNRHNTFSLSNVALGVNFAGGPVGGRLVLQAGSTPSTYYQSEPSVNGATAANASGPALWKYLQEAFVTYQAPVGRGLLLQFGLCASPIGIEVIPVKDNWNWSRSNLFFGFPFYHTGLRATYELNDALAATVGIFNGWNSIVDNNAEKSLQANLTYKIKDLLVLQALYFGGVERSRGVPEGSPFRHHLDAYGQYDASDWLSVAGEFDYGFESTHFGTADWMAGALYARFRPAQRVYLALRGDRFHEHLARSSDGSSSPIFWNGVDWVSSGTVTVDVRPHNQLSLRLEYRHDAAGSPLYFRHDVQGDGSAAEPYIANAATQDTLLLGATAWF